ncbi:hypothetical protein Q1695_012450 [Nippostrongylus brasiliensis]|nr:hypothetical protein Q1695_012450 [Nippostrongylus brasiliensis]
MPLDADKNYQEQVNKRVLCQWVRILGLPTKRNPNYDQVLCDLAEKILEYPKEKGNPFSWPSAAGLTSTGPAIRCKMTYDFWNYFLRTGSRRL